ncbi:aminotransferase-like domain-containing protein [Gluconacetobacter tumulisoli]|uniref:PLP-dependent aminotransferase family protein n=1 Tax=Gluconacetobacter tumulisoli TaxID=1286189 RepID=A0A7W4K8X8_9PROT|nr:PLP-dependent aminotransferase family protein [Gluconacetobacter tumulisoli]MBB2202531.1 PLP-dependent aminotransferase family protein [Gluconacetobacter tumulisoli]
MWRPDLPSGSAPLYERLADVMECDVLSGRLIAGTRLPPQRDLAYALGISVGSVTKAYAEAERRGLLHARVGRGSYVRGIAAATRDGPTFESEASESAGNDVIDLRCNTPPPVPLAEALNKAVSELALRNALEPAVQYVPSTGLAVVRMAGAQWISSRYGFDCTADDLIQCNGGQHAITLVFSSFCRPGDTILCGSSTFYGARVAAEHLGMTLRGVTMDSQGLLPEALARAAAETRSRLLFTVPTLHNPTTRTMSRTRRMEIAEVARQYDLTIFENDAYYAYADPDGRPPQIATFAPERTLYLVSLSKGVCPGFRLAFLALPRGMARDRILRGIRALGYCPPTLGALVFARWVEDGMADAIADSIQAEAGIRLEMARAALGVLMSSPGAARTPHVWLPMSALEAERVAARALRGGVEITPPDVSIVSDDADTGLRLCLGAARDRETLLRALAVVTDACTRHQLCSGEGIM